ncbi:hypothetical protein [Photobacterium damselae]|uniref:hypothetical protein n=1 Tax=Photobacterium damselae TaxID=38293 RepID=UPI0035A8C06B
MFDLEDYCTQQFSAGRGVVIMPALGIFSVDGVLTQGEVTFAHSSCISGVSSIIEQAHLIEMQEDFTHQNIQYQLIGRSIREAATTFTGIKKSVFTDSDLAIFSFDPLHFQSFKDHDSDLLFLKLLSDQAFNALNVIRFMHCDLFVPDKLPMIPGYWQNSDGFMGACIALPNQLPEIIVGSQMGGAVSSGLGIGLESTDTIGMEGHPFVTSIEPDEPSRNEVGEIIEHALKLYNRAMYANSETLKFINVMALFEYLGTGNKYTNFKQVRPKLQSHIAQNREQYENLSEVFQMLTSLQRDGVNVGYRTRIIHEGALLEDLIPTALERKELFRDLTQYIRLIIRGMYQFTDHTLESLQEQRKLKLKTIGISA